MKTVQVPGSQEPSEVWPNARTGGDIKGWMCYWATWALGSNGSFGASIITEVKQLLGKCFYFFGKVRGFRYVSLNKDCDYGHHQSVFFDKEDDLSFYGVIKDVEVARSKLMTGNPEHTIVIVTVHFDQLNNDGGILRRFMVIDKQGDPSGAMIDSWWELQGKRYSNGIYFGAARFELD